MVTTGPRDGGGDPQPTSAVVAKQRLQRKAAVLALRRRRRSLAPIGAAASGPIESSVATKVVIQTDFPNLVGSSSGVEVKIVRDADGKMRFYVEDIPGALIVLDSITLDKLLGGGLSVGATAYCDGTSWVVLDPPVVKRRLTHDGGGSDVPYWDPV